MKNVLTCVLASAYIISPSLAGDKYTVKLTEKGFSSFGGERAVEIKMKFSNGWNNGPMTVEGKISALEQKLAFFRLMQAKKVDLSKQITAIYTEESLSKILKELIPNVPVTFKGVKEDETVKSMKIEKASLEKVMKYLDQAAGVYFFYSQEGILITAKPHQVEEKKAQVAE